MSSTQYDKNVQDNAENPAHQVVRRLLIVLDGALKKLNLYSESHSIYQDSLNLLKKLLYEFSDRFDNLKIEIEKGQILYDGEVVHQAKNELMDFAYILYRDGVIWIEFQAGIELWEIDVFLKVLHRFSKLEIDAEDDLVSALWGYDLPSILYQATDLNLEAGDDLNISEFQCCPEEAKDLSGESETTSDDNIESEKENSGIEANPMLLVEQDGLWEITPHEREELRKMIAEEEKLDRTDYVIEIMLYILQKKTLDSDEVVELLDTLMQDLKEVLVKGRYAYLRMVLNHLRKYLKTLKYEKHFSAPYLERFFETLSGKTFLSVLSELWEYVENCGPTELKDLKNSLLLMNTSAIQILGPMLLETTSPKTQKLLMETIGSMANRDFRLFEQLISSSPDLLTVKLIYILGFLKSQNVRETLLSLLHHDSTMVREEALKKILALDEVSLQDIFELIDDPNKNMRKLLLNRIGQQRSERMESLLLKYLKAKHYRFKDASTLFSICRTLGRCGSDRSIPDLRKQLFWLPSLGILRFRDNKRRQAAVMALKELNTEKATSLVEIDSRHFFQNLLRPNKP